MSNKKKPYDQLSTVGAYYEVTVLEDVTFEGVESRRTFQGEFRGWYYDERHGYSYAIIWEIGASKAEEYYTEDILAVKPIKKPDTAKFFTPYKGRTVAIGQTVDIYRNLHTENGFSIRDSKSGLVLAHCSTVRVKAARFMVNESGRQKTIHEKRKRVHAFVRGQLVAYNEELPMDFKKVLYNPYFTEQFMVAETNTPIIYADEVFCSDKYAYAKVIEESDLFGSLGGNFNG